MRKKPLSTGEKHGKQLRIFGSYIVSKARKDDIFDKKREKLICSGWDAPPTTRIHQSQFREYLNGGEFAFIVQTHIKAFSPLFFYRIYLPAKNHVIKNIYIIKYNILSEVA